MIKKIAIISINTILILVIAALITATWMPVIYNTQWFQTNHWVRVHMLHSQSTK